VCGLSIRKVPNCVEWHCKKLGELLH
jgi:hypothetical protein